MAAHDKDMDQQRNKGNQDPNRTQSSGMGGSTSQQSGKQSGTQQGSQGSQSGSSKGSGSSGSERR
jgi:hypothetical protein